MFIEGLLCVTSWIQLSPPTYLKGIEAWSLEPENANLFRNEKDFADIMKDLEMGRLSYII